MLPGDSKWHIAAEVTPKSPGDPGCLSHWAPTGLDAKFALSGAAFLPSRSVASLASSEIQAYDRLVESNVAETAVAPENEEATEAWSGVLFDRFVEYRDLIATSLALHGEAAMKAYPPRPGDRVLDIGCGFGDTTQALAGLIGPEGDAVGVDVSKPFVEASMAEANEAGVTNVSFRAGDVQVMDLGGPYDYAFSRMGIMFFANPVAAMRNVLGSLAPGGRLVGVVWRRKLDNPKFRDKAPATGVAKEEAKAAEIQAELDALVE